MDYDPADYWAESLSIAADECELDINEAQLKYMADAMAGSHDNYGMAFYSPPSSDRLNQIEREWKAKYEGLQKEFEAFQCDATQAVRTALRQPSDVGISIGKNGEVVRYDGRSTVIQ